jgi:cytochrome b561
MQRLKGFQVNSMPSTANMKHAASAIAPASYDLVTIVIHWTICLLVIALCIIGFLFNELEFRSEPYQNYYYWHRSLGEIAFVLTLFSLVWRRFRKAPPRFADVAWRSKLADMVKLALVALLVLVPLFKIWRGAYGAGWAFFSWQVPAPLPANVVMGHFLTACHYYTAIALIALSLLHSAAALWHHFLRKDALLLRMTSINSRK